MVIGRLDHNVEVFKLESLVSTRCVEQSRGCSPTKLTHLTNEDVDQRIGGRALKQTEQPSWVTQMIHGQSQVQNHWGGSEKFRSGLPWMMENGEEGRSESLSLHVTQRGTNVGCGGSGVMFWISVPVFRRPENSKGSSYVDERMVDTEKERRFLVYGKFGRTETWVN